MHAMRFYKYFQRFLLFILLMNLGQQQLLAQSDAEIKGMKIEVAADAVTFLQFNSSIPNFDWDEKDSYTIRKRGKDALIISSITDVPKNSRLIVTEGGRSHNFVLVFKAEYDPNTVSLEHDFRDMKTLRQLALQSRSNPEPVAEVKPVEKKVDKAALEKAEKEKLEKEELKKKQEESATRMIDETYKDAITKADKFFEAKAYSQSKSAYYEALAIKPNEGYPKKQLAAIDQKLGEMQTQPVVQSSGKQTGDDNEKRADKEYSDAIDKADKSFANRSYYSARLGYTEAAKLKPGEEYPKKKIKEIDGVLAEIAAKEQQEKERIAKQKDIDDKYAAAIVKADKAIQSKNYDAAKASYYTAMGLKPNEPYPTGKLAEIEQILATKAAEENEKLAKTKLKEIDDKYAVAIAKADKAFRANDFSTAEASYNAALELKPGEEYPAMQQAAIEKKRMEIAALEAAEKDRLEKLKAIDNDYNKAISTADAALADKNYDDAKVAYYAALELKPGEQYPKTKLAAIEKALIAEAVKENEAKEAARLKKYETALSIADKAFATNDYTAAEKGYKEALAIIPDKAYPQKQLFTLDKIKTDQANLENQAKEREINKKVEDLLLTADGAFAAKDYTAAKLGYKKVLDVKPSDARASKQLALLNDASAMDMLAKKALNDKYNNAISLADKALAAKSYNDARTFYNEALTYKPEEKYPQSKLADINEAIAQANKSLKEKELNDKYLAAIAKADKALAGSLLDEAKAGYYEALGIKSDEKYPAGKIEEIEAKIAAKNSKLAKDQELADKYAAAIKAADAALADNKLEEAKAGYEAALEVKPTEVYPKTKLTAVNKQIAASKPAEPIVSKDKGGTKSDVKKGGKTLPGKKEEVVMPTSYMLPLTVQQVNIPYTQPQLFKNYPKFVFGDAPYGQKTTSDYFFPADTLKCWEYTQSFLQEEPTLNISDSSSKVSVTLQGINFSGANAYYKFLIRNFDTADFLMGTITLSWFKRDGSSLYLFPCYITGFPVIQPGHEMTVVYVARNANATDKDLFSFEVNDRLKKHRFEMVFSGEIYNQEVNK
jgi:hypothetical protein